MGSVHVGGKILALTSVCAHIGIVSIPDNVVMDTNGKVVARGLNANEMRERLEKMLKKSSP